MDVDQVSEFALSEDAPSDLTVSRGNPLWAPAQMDGVNFLAMRLEADEWAESPAVLVGPDSMLILEIADGSVSVDFVEGDFPQPLVATGFSGRIALAIGRLAGRTGRVRIAASERSHVVRWIIGREDRLGILHARTHQTRRIANETRHFTTVYDNPAYAHRGVASESAPLVPPDPRDAADGEAEPQVPARQPGEAANLYASRVLEGLIGRPLPDFAKRLDDLGTAPRILSLCSGAAGVERGILAASSKRATITLVDINEALLGRATATLSPYADVRAVVANVNELGETDVGGPYDAVLCVSGLHHVVEIEHVLGASSKLLRKGGEFWVIGEAIGPNGNRLWPEGRAEADACFRSLPPELRKNGFTGNVDDVLPNNDFSATSFEGIRSEELETLLMTFFEPIDVYRRNCFLWRFIDPTYSNNYDLEDPRHLEALRGLILAEYNLWRRGGRACEMWGAFRRR